MNKLQVYVTDGCWACEEARRLVLDMADVFPQLTIELIDVQTEERPPAVFAVPTYLLDGQVIFLGNPTHQELNQKLTSSADVDSA